MNLEVGKTYINGLDEVVRITKQNDNPICPFRDQRGNYYTHSGRYIGYGSRNFNLIKEVPQ